MDILQAISKLKSNLDLPFQEDSVSLLIQEAASIGTWNFHLDSCTVYWSSVTKKIHGVSLDFEPSLEDGIKFYKEGHSRNRIEFLINNAIETGEKFDDEFIIVTQQGQEKWVRSIGIPVFENGGCVRVYGVFQDIDSKKKAQLLLEENALKFKRTFDNAPNGAALIGKKGEWLDVNSEVCSILEYSREELYEMDLMDLIFPEDQPRIKRKLKKLIAGEKVGNRVEIRCFTKSGATVWCLFSITLINCIQSNTPDYFICQFTNITSLKIANSQIALLFDQKEIQNKKLLNFKHIVSHNLRSHTSNLEMLLNFLEQDIPEVRNTGIFNMLTEASQNLFATVSNLSQVSGFENVKLEEYKWLDLLCEINKTLLTVQGVLMDIEGTVDVQIVQGIEVSVIPEYLRSCFLNIISNAIKYRDPVREFKLIIEASLEDDYYVISFTDNGLGIDLELHRDKLFGLYKTFHRHPDSKGLGLYIVKNQLEAMGGDILVESEPGVGSSFKMYLKK